MHFMLHTIFNIQGMGYLEEKIIVHRDLSAKNILVATETSVKISDFKMSRVDSAYDDDDDDDEVTEF